MRRALITLAAATTTLMMSWVAFPLFAADRSTGLAEAENRLQRLRAVAGAEAAAGEPRVAESLFREAHQEALFLLGRLQWADGDRESAVDFLTRAEGLAEPPKALRWTSAWNRLLQGSQQGSRQSAEQGLTDLRALSEQYPDDGELRRDLVLALASMGRSEEHDAERAALVNAFPELAAGLPSADLATELPERSDPLASVPDELRRAAADRLTDLAEDLRRRVADLAGRNLAAPGAEPVQVRSTVDVVGLTEEVPSDLHGVVVLIEKPDIPGAEAEIQRLLPDASTPEASTALRTLWGLAALVDGRSAEAESRLEAAIEPGTQPLRARQALARLYLADGRAEEAKTHLLQAAELGPLDRDLSLYLADLEIADGRRAAALRQLVSVDRRYGSVESQVRLAAVYGQFSNRKRALDFLEKALQTAPHSLDVRRRHARLALQENVVPRAQVSAEVLVRLAPETAEFHELRGRVLMALRKMGEASEALLRAVELEPDRVSAFLPLGVALNHETRFEEGADYLRRYVDARPDDLAGQASLAESEERLGLKDEARARVDAVLEKEPDSARALLVLGMLHFGDRDFAAARSVLEKSVLADPKLSKAHYQLSLACARSGDRECARRHLTLYRKAQKGPEGDFQEMTRAPGSAPATLMQPSAGPDETPSPEGDG